MELKIVNYNTANLLYDAGFPQNTEECYINGNYSNSYTQWLKMEGKNHKVISAPTQELARKFLRDKHNVSVEIQTPDTTTQGWSYLIHIVESVGTVDDKEGYDSYEQALEEGLQQACEYLKEQANV